METELGIRGIYNFAIGHESLTDSSVRFLILSYLVFLVNLASKH